MANNSNNKNRPDPISTSKELISGNSKVNKLNEENNMKMTPDFIPMLRIIFWNSVGFFSFHF
ncbi:MAG: hypothetical protein KGD67_02745 [Candidatus Lokiarchaeota archaeon]|nr:hypothetical protein [Candidatus Lokiarchaeota archaeon]